MSGNKINIIDELHIAYTNKNILIGFLELEIKRIEYGFLKLKCEKNKREILDNYKSQLAKLKGGK